MASFILKGLVTNDGIDRLRNGNQRRLEETGNCSQTPLPTCSGVDDFFPGRKARDRQNGRPWISTLEWKLRLELSGDQDAALISSSLGYYAVSVSDGVL